MRGKKMEIGTRTHNKMNDVPTLYREILITEFHFVYGLSREYVAMFRSHLFSQFSPFFFFFSSFVRSHLRVQYTRRHIQSVSSRFLCRDQTELYVNNKQKQASRSFPGKTFSANHSIFGSLDSQEISLQTHRCQGTQMDTDAREIEQER